MHLVIFDIDGTIIDSVESDDACFVQAFEDIFNLNLSQTDWNKFENITDSGLSRDIFLQAYNRLPEQAEIEELKDYYYHLLSKKVNEIKPIGGAEAFVDYLQNDNKVSVAFATGGWKKTALLKSGVTSINISRFVHKTADDHYNRAEILRQATEECLNRKNLNAFDKITSIGDGLWDLKTAKELGIEFIGIDCKSNGKLKAAGAEKVVSDFTNVDEWKEWVL